MERALQLPGFYGEEAIRLEDRNGLTVSYWRSLEDIKGWRDDAKHTATRRLGIANWYERYDLRVAEVSRSYGLGREQRETADPKASHEDKALAVIFSSLRSDGNDQAYQEAAEKMAERAGQQVGFQDLISLKSDDGYGITISFWRRPSDCAAWRADPVHQKIQELGRARWYRDYFVRVGKVLRQKKFSRAINRD